MIIIDNYILDDLKHYAINHLLYKNGNKVDNFIRNVQIDHSLKGDMIEFVPYDRFKDIEFFTKFKAYEATWNDGYIQDWNKNEMNFKRSGSRIVVLKKLNNSENITCLELEEVSYILIYLNNKEHILIYSFKNFSLT